MSGEKHFMVMKNSRDTVRSFRLAVAQLNPVMGDIAGNLELARAARARAAGEKADLVLFTELFISGYSPEDMICKPAFVRACEEAVQVLAADTKDGGPGVVIGLPVQREKKIYNAVMLLDKGRIIAERYKIDLPNYGEFDERRVFTPGDDDPEPVVFRGLPLGLPICEDIWNDSEFCKKLARKGARLILVANASPFSRGKSGMRSDILARQVQKSGLPAIYANQFGGQDELVFDGGSFALTADGNLAFRMKHFQEDVATAVWEETSSGWRCVEGPSARLVSGLEADYNACMVGFRDYVNKNGFKDVVLGLSGGIDSALCAVIAVDALGAEHVRAVMLPYRYTSQASLDDAAACARQLGCEFETVPVEAAVEGFRQVLAPLFTGVIEGVTQENLQSRVRGTILMALSNKSGALVITTGNKSEMAVGYATLYGDMNGGFNPIKDLYKTQVYALSKWRNACKPENGKGPAGVVIPQSIIDKAPSAELREDQTDQDSLPPYPVLDGILECLVENDLDVEMIVARGYDRTTVERVEQLLYMAEYKRQQSAPGVKITKKNFGCDRRYPITNHFRSLKTSLPG